MRPLTLATAILAGVLISSSATVLAGQHAVPAAPAPTVDVQPRAGDFSPNSPANKAEQNRLSTFDAKQEKRDKALDQSLNICRC